MAKKAKMGTYQIMVEVRGGSVLFENTDKVNDVNEWLDAFNDNPQATSLKVYKLNDKGGYSIVASKERCSTRKIGFCRD